MNILGWIIPASFASLMLYPGIDMESINCDRCSEYTMEWKTLSIYNQTDKTYLNARDRIGKWVKSPKSYGSSSFKKTVDLCIPCFKHVEMAIADNVGQVFFDEVKSDG